MAKLLTKNIFCPKCKRDYRVGIQSLAHQWKCAEPGCRDETLVEAAELYEAQAMSVEDETKWASCPECENSYRIPVGRDENDYACTACKKRLIKSWKGAFEAAMEAMENPSEEEKLIMHALGVSSEK